MINVNMRVRCISVEAMQAILGLLKEESNGIWIETFKTPEVPNLGASCVVTYANKLPARGSLRTGTRAKREGHPPAPGRR